VVLTIEDLQKENAMQSFGDCRNAVLEPSEAVHSTRKKVGKAEDKVLCFAQKLYQEERLSVIS
jgi:hypothetical protein